MEAQARGRVDPLSFISWQALPFCPWGAPDKSHLDVGFQTGYEAAGFRHWAFSVSGAEKAMVIHNVCFHPDDVRWMEHVL